MTTLIANTLSSVTISADKVLDFIFTSASAAATFQVNFSLCNSTLGGKSIKCTAIPNDKEVLAYDDTVGKWVPKNVNSLVTLNGLLYKGTWDALNDYPEPTGSYKDYYIVSEAGNGYNVGDSIVHNGTTWEKISSSIQSTFGRTGTIIAQEGDYDLDQLSDVDVSTTSPASGDYLKYNGTNWIPAAVVESDPNVKTFAKTTLPTCGSSQVLKGDGASLSCVSVSPGNGSAFSGNASRAVVTDGSGALAVSSVTATEIGYIAGASSNIQTQITNLSATASAINSNSVTSAMTSGNIFVGNAGNVATSVTMSGDATISNSGALTIAANSVDLGTDTTGNYVTNITASNGLQATAAAGEGTTPNIVLGGALTGGTTITQGTNNFLFNLTSTGIFSVLAGANGLSVSNMGVTSLTSADIDGGTIDGVTIGSTTRGAASFTTISATSAVGTTTADIHFLVGNNGATEAMTILNNGNVGVGQATPSVKLDVSGAVRAGSSTIVTACGLGAENGEGSQRYNYTSHQMEYCNGTAWIPLGGDSSVTGNGYQKFGNGLIIQWGYEAAAGSNSYTTVTYPTPFPNNIFSFTATCADNTGANAINLSAALTTTTATLDSNYGIATKRPIYWMAIGN